MNGPQSLHVTAQHVEPRDVSLLRRVAVHTGRVRADSKNVPRYSVKYGVGVLAMFGMLHLWQAVGDGPMPEFSVLHPTTRLDPSLVSKPKLVLPGARAEERWEALASPLAILDEVNPAVAEWVRVMHRKNRLVFADSTKLCEVSSGQLAVYDSLDGDLTIGRGLFAEADGTIAAVLCHEYRHSRQQFPKTMLYALSFLWIEGGDPAIIENDAMLYEQQANLAIFGRYQAP